MDLGFKGKVALVTGAGSQVGFGKEVALTLARENCDTVVVTDIVDDLQKTADELKQMGCKTMAIKADITNKADVEAMIKKILDTYGRLDILCNVAGAILHKDGVPIDEQDPNIWAKQINLNLFGTMLVTQAIIPQMRKQKYGVIVNIGSGSTHQFHMGVGTYAISKYAIDLFTKQLAYVEGKNGIRCNCIAPGPAPTNFGAVFKEGVEPPPPEVAAKARESFLALFPLGRMGTPRDIANITVIMASDAVDYITGQVIQVSGGNVME